MSSCSVTGTVLAMHAAEKHAPVASHAAATDLSKGEARGPLTGTR